MTTKHTAGEWKKDRRKNQMVNIYVEREGEAFDALTGNPCKPTPKIIARVSVFDGEGDANLILAAPRLLERCKEALAFMMGPDCVPPDSFNAKLYADIKYEIEKAEGRV